jgi:N-acetylmuramoyl-L-alanine amidase
MRIIGPPTADLSTVRANLARLGANTLFLDEILPAVWQAALHYAVDPVGAVAQSAKETGFGKFPGKVKPEYHNTCGLKRREELRRLYPGITDGDNPLAHADFPSWEVGAIAHIQHLRRYAGAPVAGPILDPRYHLVSDRSRCENFADLNGRWAGSGGTTYGTDVEAIAARLSVPTPGSEV